MLDFHVTCLYLFLLYLFIYLFILLHEKFLQFDWLRAVVFQLNLKYLHVKISIGNSMICSDIWHKHHEWYFKTVVRNFTSR